MHAQQVKSKSSALAICWLPISSTHISICFEWDKFGIELIHDACLIAMLFEQFLELSCRKTATAAAATVEQAKLLRQTKTQSTDSDLMAHNNNNIYNSKNVAPFHYGFILSMHVCFGVPFLKMTTVNLLPHCVLHYCVSSFYLINWMCV